MRFRKSQKRIARGRMALAVSAGVMMAFVRPHEAPGARRAALVGCACFCLQTALLDALVWPAYFPIH